MSEVYDQYEDDDYDEDVYSEIDEIQDRLDEQDELAEINSQIRAIEKAHGATFTQDEIQEIGRLIDEEGIPAQYILDQLPPPADHFDNQFVETMEHVQEQQDRPLAQSEVDNLYEQASYLNDPRHVDDSLLRDLTKPKDRIALANERIAEHDPPAEAPETVEPLSPDATSKERIAFLDARHNGAEVEDTDSYEIGEE